MRAATPTLRAPSPELQELVEALRQQFNRIEAALESAPSVTISDHGVTYTLFVDTDLALKVLVPGGALVVLAGP